jgi:hypothetical protein
MNNSERKIRHAFMVFGLFAVLFMFAGNVTACLCENISAKELVKIMKAGGADVIFVGKVKTVAGEGVLNVKSLTVTLVVEKSWKAGDPDEYIIYSGGGCEAYFEAGKEYLVFAKKDKEGKLTTDVCMGTRIITLSKKHLKYLGKPIRAR